MTAYPARSSLNALGLAPQGTFSGFERSFFSALRDSGVNIENYNVDSRSFRALSTLLGIRPSRKSWATARDRFYHTTTFAYRLKSRIASRIVRSRLDACDFIYQVGSLWNPTLAASHIPLFIQVDYTSQLSNKRQSEWRRRPGRQAAFWYDSECALYARSALIFTTTDNARRSILNDYAIPSAKVITVKCGVNPPYDNFDCTRLPAYGANKILFVGKGFHGKGLDTLLSAFALVQARLPKATLTIVGPTGFSTQQTGVHYLGRISDPKRIRELYFEHSVFAMPSRFEPLGQVFLEAMSCKLPCIGTTLDAMPELIDDGITGALVSPGDVLQLSHALTHLLDNPAEAMRRGQLGFQKVQQEYLWSSVGTRLVKAISATLERLQHDAPRSWSHRC